MHLSEQEINRREKREELLKRGIEPYPAESWPINVNTRNINRYFKKRPEDYSSITIAGRLMSRRIMGKASFAEIQDQHGRVQIYVNRDEICPGEDKSFYNDVFKKLIDLGDTIGVKGHVFETQTGEITVHVSELKLLSKSLKPLPLPKIDDEGKVHDAFTDPEMRYRQRYVDLVVNPDVRNTFVNRTKVIKTIRKYLDGRGFLEVETPILQPIYGGASARPFKTHHNTLDMPLYLRIANELYLKRLIVGGFERVYEFAKDFRNEGMSRFHNPEFTQVELYAAYRDYEWMMDLTEEMVEAIAQEIHGTTKVKVGENEINFERPWKRYTMYEAIQEYTGVDISEMDLESMKSAAKEMGVEVDDSMGRGKVIDEIFGEKCEPLMIQPTFITDFPLEMSPLAKKHRTKEGLVERFEVMCNGKEICNAFSELNDPIDQRERFEDQLKLRDMGDDEAMVLDEDFLRALEYGMPPTAGLGIGIDRLTMIMTNQDSIQEVLFFPQMKPEKKAPVTTEQDFVDKGIPAAWIPALNKAGVNTLEELSSANPNKLHNDLCGLRKKLKLDIAAPTPDDVKSWVEA